MLVEMRIFLTIICNLKVRKALAAKGGLLVVESLAVEVLK